MNFSPDKFSYSLVERPGVFRGTNIVLFNVETGEEKVFHIAAATSNQWKYLTRHMDSLTDSQLGQWFQKREQKPKKKS